MTQYQILCLFGIPSLIALITSTVMAKLSSTRKRMVALEKGVQALLRDRLYNMYDKYMDKGYAPIWAKENFENLYLQYHSLGKNGVMDEKREKFLDLPDKPLSEEVQYG